jgi:non-ribosomal peptide synthetase component F
VLEGHLGFTHGERIYNYASADLNQLSQAVSVLSQRRETSRAVIVLFDPQVDHRHDGRQAPHFCLLQFTIEDREGHLFLNCTSYFRKEEMLYWWPINLAEVVLLQGEALVQLKGRYPELRRGPVITVAAIAYASTSCPKVAVPIIDRWLDEDPDVLWRLAYLLVWPEFSGRDALEQKWKQVLTDLVPEKSPDPNGVPVALSGLAALLTEIDKLLSVHASSELKQIRDLFAQLLVENQSYARDTDSARPSAERHARWRVACEALVKPLTVLLDACWKRHS